MKFAEIENKNDLGLPNVTAKTRVDFFNHMIAWAIDDEDGMSKINYAMLPIYKCVFVLVCFYGIDIGEMNLDNLFAIYDEMKSLDIDNGWTGEVFFTEKLFNLLEEIDTTLKQEVEIKNSLAGIVNKGIIMLGEKIPSVDVKQIDKWLNKLPKALDKMSPENREIINNVLNQQKLK